MITGCIIEHTATRAGFQRAVDHQRPCFIGYNRDLTGTTATIKPRHIDNATIAAIRRNHGRCVEHDVETLQQYPAAGQLRHNIAEPGAAACERYAIACEPAGRYESATTAP